MEMDGLRRRDFKQVTREAQCVCAQIRRTVLRELIYYGGGRPSIAWRARQREPDGSAIITTPSKNRRDDRHGRIAQMRPGPYPIFGCAV